MGLYATLHAPLPCPFCRKGSLDHAQFHLGDVHDLPDYKLGQRIRYDSNRMLGPKSRRASRSGYPEPCTACGEQALTSIVIEEGTLTASHFRSSFPSERDTVFVGKERVGSDGVLRHGTWFVVQPTRRHETLANALSRQEETILSEPLLAHLFCAWAEGEVTLRATRDADGRCITEWSLEKNETSLPHSLAARLNAAPLSSMHLGQERAALRITTLPDATHALATLQESHPTLAFTLVHSIALGILPVKTGDASRARCDFLRNRMEGALRRPRPLRSCAFERRRPSLRFFGLPEGKRYATSETEHAEILTRAHAIARQLFAPHQEIWRVHCVHIATRCEHAEALPRVGEVIEPMSDERFHVHALAEPFDEHAHDVLLRDIADDVIAYVLFFDAKRGTVFAPYDAASTSSSQATAPSRRCAASTQRGRT